MGQKGLSTIHRIDSSMFWQSFIYNKDYRWLSYNLWFAYIQFYKIIFLLNNDLILYTNVVYNNNSYVYTYSKNIYKIYKHHKRFAYHVELYCFEFLNYLLLINVFFKANLLFFKDSAKRKTFKKRISRVNSFF